MQLPITHPAHLVVVDMVANGASGGLMLRGDLLAYSSMAISSLTGLILLALHIPIGMDRISESPLVVPTRNAVRYLRTCITAPQSQRLTCGWPVSLC